MSTKNLNELRMIAKKKGIIDDNENPNPTAINYLSAAYTSPLLNQIWDNVIQSNYQSMDELMRFLRKTNHSNQIETVLEIIKALYIVSQQAVPDEIAYIIECDNASTKQIYINEFLADFEDKMYDFIEESK